MSSAQRAALNGLMRIGGQMSNVCFNLSQYQLDDPNMTIARWAHTRETLHDLWQQWDAARNRYFELEAEAKQSRTRVWDVNLPPGGDKKSKRTRNRK